MMGRKYVVAMVGVREYGLQLSGALLNVVLIEMELDGDWMFEKRVSIYN